MSGHEQANILVVDDQMTMRRIIKMTLGKCGYVNLDEAADGEVALKKAKEKQYDCILTDWNMPNMTGLQLVMALRAMAEYEKTPIMMVTTEGAKTAIVEALQAGVNAFVVKPFTAEVLKQKMETLWV